MPEEALIGRYGAFDFTTRTYKITDVRTPRPWVNVLSNDRYGLVLSQSGGGFSWLDNCQIFRLSRWEQDLVQNTFGRFLFLQDLSDPGSLWSSTLQPIRGDVDAEVEHGLGFTTFRRTAGNLGLEQTVFVPRDLDGEVWLITVRNRAASVESVRLTSYLEWHLCGVGDWHREFHRLFVETKRQGSSLIAWKHANLGEHVRAPLEEPIRAVVRWVGAESVHWITDKLAFLGPEGNLARPMALIGAQLPAESSSPRWDDPIAAGSVAVEVPGQSEVTLALVIGAAVGEAAAVGLAEGVTVEWAREALAATQSYWRTRCSAAAIPTEDALEDAMVNGWLPYQAIAGRIYARCAYYQQGGAYGYRDQLQDSLMYLELGEPENTRLQLGRHAGAMFSDGGVKHWWMPKEGWGPESWHSDTSLWLGFGTLAYLESTGDDSILDEIHPFLARDTEVPWVRPFRQTLPKPKTEDTLLEHCLRGIDRALELRSPRGLSLIGAGDWNDGLSHAGLDGKGESVWLSMFLFDISRRMAEVLERRGDNATASRLRGEAERIRIAVETHGWDGQWYLGGTRDDGKPFGSHTNEQGRIFLNPQTWAVLTGIASPERQETAMAAVREHLVTDYGALLLAPAYREVDPYIGYITRYAPGLRENGGVYSHASTWAVLAFAQMGDRETARRIFRGMLPPLRSAEDADLYAAEPYVMPGNADGPDSPYAGRAGWTWYTGSAAWMVRVAAKLANR
jgi:cellobiose phosphorylase